MAGLWADTPDYYNLAQLNRVWTSLTGTHPEVFTIVAGGRRAGTNVLKAINTGGVPAGVYSGILQKTLTPGSATIIHAFAIKFTNFANVGGEVPFWCVGDPSVWHVGLAMRADHTLVFKLAPTPGYGAGAVLGATTNPVTTGVFYHFSIKLTIHDSAGALSFRLNRNEQLNSGLGLTGLDTRNAGTAAWSRFCFASGKPNGADPIQNPEFVVCDQVVCDDVGPDNNDHPGDCSVFAQLPLTGNGGAADWTPSAGTDHGTLVDEAVANDDTDYLQGVSTGQRETLIYPALPVVLGTPKFVILRPCLKLATAGAQNVLDVVRQGGVNYDGATPQSPTSGSYAYYDFIRQRDPVTAVPWTIGGINGSELGLKVP